MITQELYKEIESEIKSQNDWQDRQATCYNMRFTGIPRARKPYPNAPDTHYALIDTLIDKLRPFYLSQIYGQERVANFVSGKQQSDEQTVQAEKFFDFTLRQRSNFERSMFTAIDFMMMYGRGPIKTYWCDKEKELRFSVIRPIYIRVPSWTEELHAADWAVHIMHLSEHQYRLNDKFKQGDDFIKSIKGRGTSSDSTRQEDDKQRREGITCGQNDHQIVLWEIYSRKDGNIVIDTISPLLGPDNPVRDQFGSPFRHGQIPITDIRYEITDQDFYSPRGVAEILAQDELELCKLRNSKLQFLDFFGHPQYKNTGAISNPVNFKPQPGVILPQGIEPIINPHAPLDFAQEMQTQRSLAEDRIQVPDLGASEHFASESDAKKTATGINAITAQAGAGDIRAGVVGHLPVLQRQRRARARRPDAGHAGGSARRISHRPERQRRLGEQRKAGSQSYRVFPDICRKPVHQTGRTSQVCLGTGRRCACATTVSRTGGRARERAGGSGWRTSAHVERVPGQG
jgi:hypothetical protein